jgi:hypothetical protein
MNEQDFSLLTEEYLDSTLSPEGRAALRAEVQANPEHRRLFEEQARQHIRIHAQTSRVDFTESQRIAVMVVDIAGKHRDPNAFMDILRRKPLRERLAILLRGLRAPRGSSTFQNAKAELLRIFTPVSVSMAVNIAVILLIFCMVPFVLPPPKTDNYPVSLRPVSTPTPLEPIEPAPAAAAGKSARNISDMLAAVTPATPSAHVTVDDTPPGPTEYDGTSQNPATHNTGTASPIPSHSPIGSIPGLTGRDPYSRSDILRKTPGSDLTEKAVLKSLRWLKGSQSADGSWPGQDNTAMTGLALLAYLAHDEVTSSSEFGRTVENALKYLLARQDSRGCFSQNVYAHAIATYAMAEAFTMTRIVNLRTPLENGVRIIIDGQQTNGSFDYNYKKGDRFDTSVTGWQIQALKAALIAGVDLPGLEESLSRSARFLLTEAFARDGSGFVYDGKPGIPAPGGGRPSMTGVGVLCLQMLGKPNSPQALAGLKTLQKAELEWPATGKAGVYAGYYITQAKFHSNDKVEWKRWNKLMQKQLLTQQKSDGHWEQGDHDNGSHVYTTTLSTLMLEVYYRYLPTYAKRPESAPLTTRSSDEVSVDVR